MCDGSKVATACAVAAGFAEACAGGVGHAGGRATDTAIWPVLFVRSRTGCWRKRGRDRDTIRSRFEFGTEPRHAEAGTAEIAPRVIRRYALLSLSLLSLSSVDIRVT